MKFDVVVGNPPFNRGKSGGGTRMGNTIWEKFIVKSWDILVDDGWLCQVHPIVWRTNRHSRKKKRAADILFGSRITWIRAGFEFSQVPVDVDAYTCQKSSVRDSTLWHNADGTEYRFQIDSDAEFLLSHQSKLISSITRKVLTEDDNGLMIRQSWGGLTILDESITGEFEFVHGRKRKQIRHPHIFQNEPKVFMASNRDFKPFYDPGELGIGDHVHVILLEEAPARWFIAFVDSRLSRFFQYVWCPGYDAARGKHGKHPFNAPQPLKKIRISSEEPGDDAYFYRYFGLTQQEIDYIERTVA